MEHTLTLASYLMLLIPMPLLIVFSLVSLVRQTIRERSEVRSPKNALKEKRNFS